MVVYFYFYLFNFKLECILKPLLAASVQKLKTHSRRSFKLWCFDSDVMSETEHCDSSVRSGTSSSNQLIWSPAHTSWWLSWLSSMDSIGKSLTQYLSCFGLLTFPVSSASCFVSHLHIIPIYVESDLHKVTSVNDVCTVLYLRVFAARGCLITHHSHHEQFWTDILVVTFLYRTMLVSFLIMDFESDFYIFSNMLLFF